MAKKIKQVRFYENGSLKNSSTLLTSYELTSGRAFVEYTPIFQLGIQALPGTKFYLNGDLSDSIIIGNTGIFELDLTNGNEITGLAFDPVSIANISANKNAYLIVDMIYDKRED